MPYGEEFATGPPPTKAELLTEQFYEWERRGRGWNLYRYPVDVEPPFVPFLGHYVTPTQPYSDDTRKPTFLSTLIERLRGASTGMPPPPLPGINLSLSEDAKPELYEGGALVELRIMLPPTAQVSRQMTEQFLSAMTYCEHALSYELIGLPEEVASQLVCAEEDASQLRQQFRAYFPEAIMTEADGLLRTRWDDTATKQTAIVEFGLSEEFMRPLYIYERFETDPLIGIVGALAEVRDGEIGLLQVVFRRTRHPWAESILRSVTDGAGGSFFADAPEMVALAKEKVRRPLFASVVRVAAQSEDQSRAWQIVKMLGGALAQFSSTLSNELIPLINDGYDDELHARDVALRATHRTGILLNAHELISLVHLPGHSVRSEKLARETKKTKAAPSVVLDHALFLGENHHAGKTIKVTLAPSQRTRHTYVIGASGTGKSTLLLNLIIQDIAQGQGVAVLDPHGDMVDQILGYIPENRHGDVVLVDPSDEEYPVGFNILSAHSEIEKNLLASDLVSVFKRLSTSWGDQMTSVLGNGILAFLESERGGTLADLRRFLVEPDYRRSFLETVRDREVVYYWQKEFPMLVGKAQAPLLTRLDTFLRPKLIRQMVGQKENRLDFRAIMNEGKIFLAKLAQGAIGEENAYLLGTLLVSKFHQLAMSRQEVAESSRRDFYLYIDEFQNFITPSMASILAGARKYHVGLTLAHQDLRQLISRDEDVASAVISNPATRVCFRLGDFDAKKLAEGFSFFDARDLQNLGVGEAIGRVERTEYDFNLKTPPLPKLDAGTAEMRYQKVFASSRRRYGRRREDVEAELALESATAMPETTPSMPATATVKRVVPPTEPRPATEKPAGVRHDTPRQSMLTGKPTRSPSVRMPTQTTLPLQSVLPGRGGSQHKYLQQLIKRWGECKGYRVTVEKQIFDGLGAVDVALENEKRKIACEICVNSTPERELGNIQKCLAAGFEYVVSMSNEKKTLASLKELVSAKLSEKEMKQVRFLTPGELFSFVESIEADSASKQETVRGYRVKVQYKPVGEQEKQGRKKAISDVIMRALKKLKKSKPRADA